MASNKHRPTEGMKVIFITLYRNGQSSKTIGENTGFSAGCVRNHLRKSLKLSPSGFQIGNNFGSINRGRNIKPNMGFQKGEAHPFYTGAIPRHDKPPNWRNATRRAEKKWGNRCICCGSKKIHWHHIIPWTHSRDNNVENLMPLCSRHHKLAELFIIDFMDLNYWGNDN